LPVRPRSVSAGHLRYLSEREAKNIRYYYFSNNLQIILGVLVFAKMYWHQQKAESWIYYFGIHETFLNNVLRLGSNFVEFAI